MDNKQPKHKDSLRLLKLKIEYTKKEILHHEKCLKRLQDYVDVLEKSKAETWRVRICPDCNLVIEEEDIICIVCAKMQTEDYFKKLPCPTCGFEAGTNHLCSECKPAVKNNRVDCPGSNAQVYCTDCCCVIPIGKTVCKDCEAYYAEINDTD